MKLLHLLLIGTLFTPAIAQTVGSAPATWDQPSHLDSTAELAQLLQAKPLPITIEKYDLVSVHVYGADALNVKGRVSEEGGLDIPLAGFIHLAGLTIDQAQRAVARLVEDKSLIISPAVTVEIVESPGRVISVDGEVAHPGVFPIYGDDQLPVGGSVVATGGVSTLGQAIALAGGLKDTASGIITLSRPTLAGPISIPLGTDANRQRYNALPIFPGDEIRVPHVGEAYVIGAVKKQGAIPLKNFSPTTVAMAIALSDGMGFEAAENDGRLVRTEGDHRVVLKVPVRKIIEGKATDIVLQNDDILYVPTNQGKAALKSGAAGLIVSLASTYIYAHP